MRSILLLIVLIIAQSGIAQSTLENQALLGNEFYVNGEYEKAEDIFKKLSSNTKAIPLIHSNYLSLLIKKSEFSKAEKYLKSTIDKFPTNQNYYADLIAFYNRTSDEKSKNQAIEKTLDAFYPNQYQLKLLAENLVNKEQYKESLIFYQKARELTQNSFVYSLDIASVYRLMGEKDLMIEEYLLYASANSRNTRYIKNVFQQLLSDPEDLDKLERILFQKVQNFPDNTLFMDLLIWVEIQRRNYYGAFVQARALDRRNGTPGSETMEIGKIALDNRAWDDAVDIYTYVINNYGPNSQNYTSARQNLIKAREGKIVGTYPVDKQQIFQLTLEYQKLYDEFGPTPITLEALRNKARLNAFYLDNKEAAVISLTEIIETPRVSGSIRDMSKMDLGDIYLLKDEPWEATLLYSQVEKSNKYAKLGYQAKLKNARLNYFTGNFALAKSHLDVLKKATTKQIANDAISLSVLIKNNTILDTTDATMQKFANAQLLIYQNKNDQAIQAYNELLEEIPDHSLTDEILWELANLQMKKGEYTSSIDYLDQLLDTYQYDILADDALFLKAEITEKYLLNTESATELYREFIERFPGSMYAAEARKRYRILRGDEIN